MKLTVSSIAWKNEEEAAVAALLQAHDIRGVDVAYTKFWAAPTDASPEALADYRAFWAQHGIAIVGMQSLIYGRPDLHLFGAADVRTAIKTYLDEVIRLAGALGARPLVFGSPKNRVKGSLPDAEAFDTAGDFFAALAETAAAHGVVVCIEPNPPEYGCDFITTTASAVALVSQVNHPHFRLHLDTAIMTMTGEPVEAALEAAADVLAHFHISEPQLGVVGEGTVDHPRFAAALRRIGYAGWTVIEMRSGWKNPDIEAVRTALTYALEIYGD